MTRFNRYQVSSFTVLLILCGLFFLAVAAFAQQGGRDRGNGGGGDWRRGGGHGQPVQQRPGKPPEERFIRVCKVLEMEKDQLKKARKLYDDMVAGRDSVLSRVESGETPEDVARSEIGKLEENFKVRFSALLNEDQLQKMLKLQEAGTLEDRWW